MSEDEQAGYAMKLNFWIDTDAYGERDQRMFCYGFEYCQIAHHLEHDDGPLSKPVHRENESRIRMAAGTFGRRVSLEPCKPDHDPDGTWSWLEVEPK